QGPKEDIEATAELLSAASKPLLLVGHGVQISGGCRAVRLLAEKLNCPVVTTLLGKGGFPETHQLSMGMLGMHGTAYANMAVRDCDLIMSIGARWDDRILGDPKTFCANAKKIHVDIDQAENGKLVRPDVFVHGDARLVIEELNTLVNPGDTKQWVKECTRNKKRYPLKYRKQGGLHAEYVLDHLGEHLKNNAIITTDVGQHQMWAAQYIRSTQPNTFLSSGGAG
ncbi:MAG: acetolactate synthase large subunit, partial [Planctomycetes bacterium]|nr:acetolactate synthase large subunit [Planctomycetota bacterium]